MSKAAINKVDMSLDDIIKINKVEKKQKAKLNAARGANSTRSRGGRGKATGRGRGRGGAVVVNAVRGGSVRGKGSVRGGVAQGRGSPRGRGGRQLLQNSPAIRGKSQQLTTGRGNSFRGRGGRGQSQRARGSGVGSRPKIGGLQGGIQLFTRSGLNKQTAAQQQNERLNKARKQAALLREKQLALKNLQQAQKNMQTVTLALQRSSRDAAFNQRRGLSTAELPTATTNGRGRRKLLANLGRNGAQASNLNNNISYMANLSGSNRHLNYTSVTISNPEAFQTTQSPRGRRRPWNKPRVQPAAQPFKIEVANQSPLPTPPPQSQQQSSVMEKLKSLKPAVPTTYKFQKNVFSAPTTGISLSERFAGTVSSSSENHLEERKVFV